MGLGNFQRVNAYGAGIDAMPKMSELQDRWSQWMDYRDLLTDEGGVTLDLADEDVLEIVELLRESRYDEAMKLVRRNLEDQTEGNTEWDAVVAIGPHSMDMVQRWDVYVHWK